MATDAATMVGKLEIQFSEKTGKPSPLRQIQFWKNWIQLKLDSNLNWKTGFPVLKLENCLRRDRQIPNPVLKLDPVLKLETEWDPV